jgi:serine/threonine protein kinase
MLGRTLLGQYTISRKLGEGGFGAVYIAEQPSMQRQVAVKTLHRHLASNEAQMMRFRREGVAASKLVHPSVVKVFNFGDTDDGYLWIAMELLAGESLSERIARAGVFTVSQLMTLLLPLCEALQEAHDKGITHRDLKPQNIFLLSLADGKILPKILDFGIAGLVDDNTITNSRTISGTPQYMPPEQWRGLTHADHRSDIYALALIIYQCLTARLPFEAETAPAWMTKHCLEAPMSLSMVVNVPSRFSQAIMKALSKDPADRPQRAMDLYQELLSTIEAPVSSGIQRAVQNNGWRWSNPKPQGNTLVFVWGISSQESVASSQGNTESRREGAEARATRHPSGLTTGYRLLATKSLFILGVDGVIMCSRDRGLSWEMQQSNTRQNLREMHGFETGELFVVGENGTLLFSDDEGEHWRLLPHPSQDHLCDIWGTSPNHLFTVGDNGSIYHSSDAGKTWQKRKSPTRKNLYAIWGFSSQGSVAANSSQESVASSQGDTEGRREGTEVRAARHSSVLTTDYWLLATGYGLFICGEDGVLLSSRDGGLSWQVLTSGVTTTLGCLYGTSLGDIYAVGADGIILHSSDEGRTWTQQMKTIGLFLYFVSGNGHGDVFVIGAGGVTLRSNDRGKTWTPMPINTARNMGGVWCDGDMVMIVGEGGSILQSEDRGDTWEELGGVYTAAFRSICSSQDELYVVGEQGLIVRSSNGGQTWSQLKSGTVNNLYGVWSLGQDHVFAVGEDGTFLSSDSSRVWKVQKIRGAHNLMGIWGSSLSDLYAVGTEGVIVRSVDAGQSWEKLKSHTNARLCRVWGLNHKSVFAVGWAGTLLHSQDNGRTWQARESHTSQELYAVWGGRDGFLYCVGAGGTILVSSDGGLRWELQESGLSQSIYHVWGDATRVYICGDSGLIACSTDKGKTWERQTTPTKNWLYSLCGDGRGQVFAVGLYGTILLRA